jgi:hypothetical protein
MKIIATFITLLSLATCNNYKTGKYTFNEITKMSYSYGMKPSNSFYLDAGSLKENYKGKKLSLQNFGIKIIDSDLNVLRTVKV